MFHEMSIYSIPCRILSAALISGIIGLERGMKHRPAGFRTYMLVCVGACLIMLTNQYIYQFTGAGDPMRLGAQVVSGIGFLGAGTIIITRHNQIKGLTTAAGLWSAAGLGLALGIGFYEGAVCAGLVIYLILTVLQYWDGKMHRNTRTLELYVEYSKQVALGTLLRQIRELEANIEGVQLEEGTSEADTKGLIATLKLHKRENHDEVIFKIKQFNGVLFIEEL